VQRGQGAIVEQHAASGPALLDWLKNVWDLPRVAPPSPPAAELIAADLARVLEGR